MQFYLDANLFQSDNTQDFIQLIHTYNSFSKSRKEITSNNNNKKNHESFALQFFFNSQKRLRNYCLRFSEVFLHFSYSAQYGRTSSLTVLHKNMKFLSLSSRTWYIFTENKPTRIENINTWRTSSFQLYKIGNIFSELRIFSEYFFFLL